MSSFNHCLVGFLSSSIVYSFSEIIINTQEWVAVVCSYTPAVGVHVGGNGGWKRDCVFLGWQGVGSYGLCSAETVHSKCLFSIRLYYLYHGFCHLLEFSP